MIRRASAALDIPFVEGMIRDVYAASKYHGRVEISDKTMRELLLGAVAGQNQFGPQASYFRIAEERGEPVGFMLGILDRVYHIGTKLRANDVFLCVRPGARIGHTLRLIDGYVEWATGNPKVIEVVLSWTDTAPGAGRIGEIYERKGFTKTGEIYELRRDEERIAA